MRSVIPVRFQAMRSTAPRLLAVMLMTALVSMAAGCSSPSAPAYDLTAPRLRQGGGGTTGAQLVVTEPTAIQPLEDQRIMARDAAGSVSYIADAQWADRLPRLFQTRLIQTFENASRIRAVSRPGEGVTADFQLNSDLRAFQLDSARGEAFVEVSVKLLSNQSGKIVNARVFSARLPVADLSGPTVAQALDRAQGTVLLDIVRWVGTRG